jgi:hypothetical protein
MSDEPLDLADTLINVLTTEEGQNVADLLAELSENVDIIGQQMVVQNKILVKILAAMSPASPVAPKADN